MTPMQEIKQRLIELGVPPQKIVGCTEAQIEEIMQAQGVSYLPEAYLDFLRTMGRRADYLMDSEYLYPQLLHSKDNAIKELEIEHSSLKLPADAFVWYFHDQLYTFAFFHTEIIESEVMIYQYFGGDEAFSEAGSLLTHFRDVLRYYERYL